MSTPVQTALVKMSFFVHFVFAISIFFQRCFLIGSQNSKKYKIWKQQKPKTTRRRKQSKNKSNMMIQNKRRQQAEKEKQHLSKFRGRLEVGEVSSKHTCFLSVLEPDFPNYFLTGFHSSPAGFSKFWHFSLQQTSGAWGLLNDRFVNHQDSSLVESSVLVGLQAWARIQHLLCKTIFVVTKRKTLAIQ